MLERVLGHRVKRRRMNELVRFEGAECLPQRALRELDDRVKDGCRELQPDHRCGLQDLLLALRQPVDPRRKDRVDRVGNLQGVDPGIEAVRAPSPDEPSVLDQ